MIARNETIPGYARQTNGLLVPDRVADRTPSADDDPARPQSRTSRDAMHGSGEDAYHVRRWDAAATDRLNETQWAAATGRALNVDLRDRLQTLWNRCELEASVNPLVDGVINTHVADLIGGHGPIVHPVSRSDPEFARRLKTEWANWWESPDYNEQMSGCELIALWIRDLWIHGELFTEKTTDRSATTPVNLRLLALNPRRLRTPPNKNGKPNIVMGVEVTRTGRPVTYWLEDHVLGEQFFISPQYRAKAPKNIIHEFRILEAGQLRGVPWLAAALQAISDIRHYDQSVLDAARNFADWSIYAYSTHDQAEVVTVRGSTPIKRRQLTYAPPGYQLAGVQGEQPKQNYIEHRKERLRELGRPVGMPLVRILLDASGHNYSSARFDDQGYRRFNETIQCWLTRRVIKPLVRDVMNEAQLSTKSPLRGPVPDDLHIRVVWPRLPHVDPAKERIAQKIGRELGALTLADILAEDNKVLEDHLAALEEEQQQIADHELSDTIGAGAIDTNPDGTTSGSGVRPDQNATGEQTPGGDTTATPARRSPERSTTRDLLASISHMDQWDN